MIMMVMMMESEVWGNVASFEAEPFGPKVYFDLLFYNKEALIGIVSFSLFRKLS